MAVKKKKTIKRKVKPKKKVVKRVAKKKAIKKIIKKKVVKKKVSPVVKDVDFIQKKNDIKIKIFGIGGGGCSIVKHIAKINKKKKNISFIAVNTDIQSLASMPRTVKSFIIGKNQTGGLGCGMNALLGEQIAIASKDQLQKEIIKSDFCIVISTLGGGTGSGVSPVFSNLLKILKKPSLGFFTIPFEFEGEKRKRIAINAMEKIEGNLSSSVIIPNENIFDVIDPKTAIKESFHKINENLAYTIKGLLETIQDPGLINVDYADFMTIMDGNGKLAYLNSVEGERKDLTRILEKLLLNPLVKYGIRYNQDKDVIIPDRILFNISGPVDLKIAEVNRIANEISSPNLRAKIIFGVSLKKTKSNIIRTTLLAIGKRANKDASRLKKMIFNITEPKIEKKEEEPKKKKKKKKEKKKQEKKAVIRRTAIQIEKKKKQEEKKEIQDEEDKWDIPAFLRANKQKYE